VLNHTKQACGFLRSHNYGSKFPVWHQHYIKELGLENKGNSWTRAQDLGLENKEKDSNVKDKDKILEARGQGR